MTVRQLKVFRALREDLAFSSKDPHDSLQQSITPVLGDLGLYPDFLRLLYDVVHTHMFRNVYTHTHMGTLTQTHNQSVNKS